MRYHVWISIACYCFQQTMGQFPQTSFQGINGGAEISDKTGHSGASHEPDTAGAGLAIQSLGKFSKLIGLKHLSRGMP